MHHVMNGAHKKKAEADGLIIYVCADCHRRIHDSTRQGDAQPLAQQLKARAQAWYMLQYGKSTADFIKRYGKSYL